MHEELGPGAWRLHYDVLDFNVGLVVGDEGSLVIDTRSSGVEASELQSDLTRLGLPPVKLVLNTHHHWDHSFGNQVFAGSATLYGHPECRRRLIDDGERVRDGLIAAMPERSQEFADVRITPPDLLIPERTTLDPGGAAATVRYLGRGHTDNDLVVTLGDVLYAGDLVEEGGPPGFSDSYPVAWAATLREVENLGCDVVVPAHGNVVDLAFVTGQAELLEAVAGRAQVSMREGRRSGDIDAAGLDLPPEVAKVAFGRAYLELSELSPKSR